MIRLVRGFPAAPIRDMPIRIFQIGNPDNVFRYAQSIAPE